MPTSCSPLCIRENDPVRIKAILLPKDSVFREGSAEVGNSEGYLETQGVGVVADSSSVNTLKHQGVIRLGCQEGAGCLFNSA